MHPFQSTEESAFLLQLRLSSPIYSHQEKQVFKKLPPSAVVATQHELRILTQLREKRELVDGKEWKDQMWIAASDAYYEEQDIVLQELAKEVKREPANAAPG